VSCSPYSDQRRSAASKNSPVQDKKTCGEECVGPSSLVERPRRPGHDPMPVLTSFGIPARVLVRYSVALSTEKRGWRKKARKLARLAAAIRHGPEMGFLKESPGDGCLLMDLNTAKAIIERQHDQPGPNACGKNKKFSVPGRLGAFEGPARISGVLTVKFGIYFEPSAAIMSGLSSEPPSKNCSGPFSRAFFLSRSRYDPAAFARSAATVSGTRCAQSIPPHPARATTPEEGAGP